MKQEPLGPSNQDSTTKNNPITQRCNLMSSKHRFRDRQTRDKYRRWNRQKRFGIATPVRAAVNTGPSNNQFDHQNNENQNCLTGQHETTMQLFTSPPLELKMNHVSFFLLLNKYKNFDFFFFLHCVQKLDL